MSKVSEYKRYRNKCTDFNEKYLIKCGCSHVVEIGEYYHSDGKINLCNKCYDTLQRKTYKEQLEKLNMLHTHCPFCRKFTHVLFNYKGGNIYGGQDSGIYCKECGRDFYIKLDVRQYVSALNE